MTEFRDDKLKEKYYKLKHKSGLDIYVFPKKMSSSYALFGTEYGSVDNCFKEKGDSEYTTVPDGIAHYLEHRMFTQKDGSDITERIVITAIHFALSTPSIGIITIGKMRATRIPLIIIVEI